MSVTTTLNTLRQGNWLFLAAATSGISTLPCSFPLFRKAVIIILLLTATQTIFGQAPVSECSFDRRHSRQLEADAAYRQARDEYEERYVRAARERLLSATFQQREEQDMTLLALPVVVHLFYPPDADEAPNAAEVRRALALLNDGFRHRNDFRGGPFFSNAGIDGVDTAIEFRLAESDPDGQAGSGIEVHITPLAGRPIDERIGGTEVLDSLLRLAAWPSTEYLNIFILPSLCDLDGDCPAGFSYPAAAHGRLFDGIYLTTRVLREEPGVLIHEAGHYLNLYHTFEGGCEERNCLEEGDRICDTPPDCFRADCVNTIPNCLLEQRQNTCHHDAEIEHSPFTSDVEDLYENFMDYGFWRCFNSFTPDQRRRMRQTLTEFRSSLLPAAITMEEDTCSIDSIELVKLEDCTPDANGVTAVLQVRHRNAPPTGSLVVNELTFPLGDSAQTVWMPLARNGAAVSVTAFFSADSTCRYEATDLFTIPDGPCITCSIDSIALVELQDCVDGEDRVNARLRIWHSGDDELGWLVVNGFSFAVKDSVQDVRLPLPRNGALVSVEAYFSDAPDCSLTVPDLFSVPDGPCVTCAVTSVELLEAPDCIPAGETATVRLRIGYEAPPESGWLLVNGYNFAVTGSPQTVALPVGAEDGPLDVAVHFSEATECRLFKLAAIPHIPRCPAPLEERCAGAVDLPVVLSGRCESTLAIAFPERLPLNDWPGACAPYGGGEHWSRLVVPESGELRITARPDSSDARLAMQLFRQCTTEVVACAYAGQAGAAVDLTVRGQLPGDTLLLATWTDTDGGAGLCAYLPTPPPPNDRCAGARPLPLNDPLLGQSCSNSVVLNWTGALRHGAPAPCGEEMVGGDLWYEVTVPPDSSILLQLLGEEAEKTVLAAYTACEGAFLGCSTPDELNRPALLLSKLAPGQRVLLQVYRTAGLRGTVELCAGLPPAAITNDDCTGARLLAVAADASCPAPVLIGNVAASPSGAVGHCADAAPVDLWYRAVVPAGGAIAIELAAYRGLVAPGLTVYDGCAGRELACRVADQEEAILTLTGQTPGDTLWIAVWERFGFKFGTAGLCLYEPPPPPNDDCAAARWLPLCADSTCLGTPVPTGGETGFSAIDIPCRESDVALWWYQVRADKEGRLVFEVTDTVKKGGMAAFAACGSELLACTDFSRQEPRLILSDLIPGDTIRLAVWSPDDQIGLRAWVPECPAMLFEADIKAVSCPGGDDGSIRLNPGTSPTAYHYRWNTGATTPRLDSLTAGIYEVAISDSYGCRDSLQLLLEEPAPLSVNIEKTPATGDRADGELRISVAGGTTPYFYRLEAGDLQKDSVFTQLAPGTYTLLVVDANGCVHWESVLIDQSTSHEQPAAIEHFTLYPNPSRGRLLLDIQLRESLSLQLEIWSASGQRLLGRRTDRTAAHRLEWLLDQLPDGLYLLRMKVAEGWVNRRFVLAR